VAQSRNFLPQNCAKSHLHAFAISKIFLGIIRRSGRIPVKMGRGGIGREVADEGGRRRKEKRRGEGSCVPNDFSFRCAAHAYTSY
jgi:hypothetical protein